MEAKLKMERERKMEETKIEKTKAKTEKKKMKIAKMKMEMELEMEREKELRHEAEVDALGDRAAKLAEAIELMLHLVEKGAKDASPQSFIFWMLHYLDAASVLPSPRWTQQHPLAAKAVSTIRRSLALAPPNKIRISHSDQLLAAMAMRKEGLTLGSFNGVIDHYLQAATSLSDAFSSLKSAPHNALAVSPVSLQLQLILQNLNTIVSSLMGRFDKSRDDSIS